MCVNISSAEGREGGREGGRERERLRVEERVFVKYCASVISYSNEICAFYHRLLLKYS